MYLLIGKYCQTALQKEKILLSTTYESVLANTEYGQFFLFFFLIKKFFGVMLHGLWDLRVSWPGIEPRLQ